MILYFVLGLEKRAPYGFAMLTTMPPNHRILRGLGRGSNRNGERYMMSRLIKKSADESPMFNQYFDSPELIQGPKYEEVEDALLLPSLLQF